jgi:hypothetical protein
LLARNLDPALPALGGQQGARGLLDTFAVGLAARVALGIGERLVVEAAGHGGLLSGLGPAPLAGRSPATRTPVRACHSRVAVRPAGGRRRLRGVVEVCVERVVHQRAVVGLGLDGMPLGVLLLANLGLGLVVGGVGARDGLLELAQRRGDVRAGELVERLRRDVLMRAPAGGRHPGVPRRAAAVIRRAVPTAQLRSSTARSV